MKAWNGNGATPSLLLIGCQSQNHLKNKTITTQTHQHIDGNGSA